MNSFDDFPAFMVRLECVDCKNVFWVPEFEDLPDIEGLTTIPAYCTFCGVKFEHYDDIGDDTRPMA